MLAALLLNLGQGPTPPTPPVVQPFFTRGGGPFTKKYGYDPRYYKQDQEELSEAQAEIVESAIEKAVEAIRTQPKPKPVVLDAKRIYERVFKEVRGIEKERVKEIWRAEVKRRIQQAEDEEMVCLMFL